MARKKKPFESDGIMHATINGHRFHLRLTDPTEENFLWIDGMQPPLVLDQTAAEFVGYLIEGMWKFQTGKGDESERVIKYVVDNMYKAYGRPLRIKHRITRAMIKKDLDRIFSVLMAIANGTCPAQVTLGPKKIDYAQWNGPARMDLAITTRCNLNCGKCYLQNEIGKELSFDEWTRILDLLWKIGVPQVVFTGGEPTLRDDLVKLVQYAGKFVTGLVTNGTKLSKLAGPLSEASLDYVQVTLESLRPLVHNAMTGVEGSYAKTVKGIKEALKAGLQVVTNTTLTKANADGFNDTLRFLQGIGVKHVACNTLICSGRGHAYKKDNGLSYEELKIVLQQAIQVAKDLCIDLQWYSPTCYSLLNPIDLGLGVKACSAAAHNMTIQPDGSVIPCQSWPNSVGNILKDDWKLIWNHETCQKLRNQAMKKQECGGCKFEQLCGGGCPLDTDQRQKEVRDEKAD